MTLYYKNDENDSLKYDFLINEHCARFNNFNHYDYSDAVPEIIDTNITLGDSILYLQAMGGIKTKIMFPNIQIWDNKTNLTPPLSILRCLYLTRRVSDHVYLC